MAAQMSFDELPPGDRDGETYERSLDYTRLNGQAKRVFDVLMKNPGWFTLAEIASYTGDPEASISARLRDLRKARFGSHVVERRRVFSARGLWEYRLVREES